MIKKNYSLLKQWCYILLLFCGMNNIIAGTSANGALKSESPEKSKKEQKAHVVNWLKNQPVEFLENKGQILNSNKEIAKNVLFKAEAVGVDLFVTDKGLSYVFYSFQERDKDEEESQREFGLKEDENVEVSFEKININLIGASLSMKNVIKEDTGMAYYNFIMDKDHSYSHVKKYRKLTFKNVYPGIDWVLYNSTKSGFKYDFIVHPGADYHQIKMTCESNQEMSLDEHGNLTLLNFIGNLQEKAPYSYTFEDDAKVESSYKIISSQQKNDIYLTEFSYELSGLDKKNQTLIIDPQLLWSTFFGGTNYEGTYCCDTDPMGNVYLCGYLASTDFPLQTMGTYFQSSLSNSGFIVKFSNSGTLLWSTFFGPGTTNYLATDNNGNLFVCGFTSSSVFPTVNAGSFFQPSIVGGTESFITKFDAAGNCIWSTYYGGSGTDVAACVVCNTLGDVYLLGYTASTNFPTQNSGGYFDSNFSGVTTGYVVKFDNSGNRLWASYLKGLGSIVGATDLNNNLYLTGQTNSVIPLLNPGGTSYYQGSMTGISDIFLLKFAINDQLIWGSYYGGTGNLERGSSVACDKFGNVFFVGITNSMDFPTLNAGSGAYYQSNNASTFQDIYILKFDSTLNRKWATYVGGSRNDFHYENDNLTIDTCGNVFLGFTTQSRNLPFQTACDGGMFDNTLDTSVSTLYNAVFLTRFSNNGNLMWSSYFCGDGNSFRTTMDADKFGNVFFSGEWNGVNNPATYPIVYPPSPSYTQAFAGYEDLYVAKFTNNLSPQNFTYTQMCKNDPNQMPQLGSGFVSGGTFTTTSSGLSINPLSGQITTSLSSPGTYIIDYITAPCYCPGAVASSLGSSTLTILTAPSLSIAGKMTICLMEKSTYTVSGGTTYTWSTGAHSQTISATPTTTATLHFTVSSNSLNGCTDSKVINITVSKCLGIEDFEIGETHLSIFPNPNSGQFTIRSDKDIDLEMTNELGQQMKYFKLNDRNNRIVEVNDLPNGTYFIKEKNSKNNLIHKIIVTN